MILVDGSLRPQRQPSGLLEDTPPQFPGESLGVIGRVQDGTEEETFATSTEDRDPPARNKPVRETSLWRSSKPSTIPVRHCNWPALDSPEAVQYSVQAARKKR
jgi:hypothetical protein